MSVNQRVWAAYIREKIAAGSFNSIPKTAEGLSIVKFLKLGGGISNDVFFSSLAYFDGNQKRSFDTVLKVYRENADEVCERESQALRTLATRNFPVPQLYIQEKSDKIFGSPFIVMENINGTPLALYIKELSKKYRLQLISNFAETLATLHSFEWDDFESKFLKVPLDEHDYALQQVKIVKNLRSYWQLGSYLDWAVTRLASSAPLNPCESYSVLHGDMNLNNFFVTPSGNIVTTDWEYPEIGDPLRDIGLAYHNIRLIFGLRNVAEGNEFAHYFLKEYKEKAHKKLDWASLRFYILLTGVLETLSYAHNSKLAVNPTMVKKMIGIKYACLFPFVSAFFRLKANNLERFLRTHLIEREDAFSELLG